MDETRCAPNLTAAFLGLLEIARALLHRRLTDSRQYQQAKVLAHISGLLALASEASNSLESAFLVELVALCKVRAPRLLIPHILTLAVAESYVELLGVNPEVSHKLFRSYSRSEDMAVSGSRKARERGIFGVRVLLCYGTGYSTIFPSQETIRAGCNPQH